MPRDPYIREKYTREISHARKVARGLLRAIAAQPNDPLTGERLAQLVRDLEEQLK
jgi:hypothetical protein